MGRFNRFGDPLADNQMKEVVSVSYLKENGQENWLEDGNNGFVPGTAKALYLPKGEKILRYGDENGYYAAPIQTPYTNLAMPYRIKTLAYNEYEVVADNTVPVIPVLKGIVGKQPAWPEESGGGIQYFFPDREHFKTVLHYVGRGLRRLEVSEWSPILKADINHK